MPEPGPGQVLVRIRAAALNSRDLQVIADQYDPEQRLPLVPVSDGAGEIAALGDGVRGHAVGDRVVGLFAQGWLAGERTWERWLTHLGGHLDGVLQDYVLFSAEGAVPVPAYLTDAEAAAATSAAATAWRAVVELGRVEPGQTVLVQGTGGVAMFALQFALLAGARVVVTSSSDEKLRRAEELGAWATVNYRTTPDWEREVLRLTGGDGVDVVVETAADLERSISCTRVGGFVGAGGLRRATRRQLERGAALDVHRVRDHRAGAERAAAGALVRRAGQLGADVPRHGTGRATARDRPDLPLRTERRGAPVPPIRGTRRQGLHRRRGRRLKVAPDMSERYMSPAAEVT